jgi:hypothetical protein
MTGRGDTAFDQQTDGARCDQFESLRFPLSDLINSK